MMEQKDKVLIYVDEDRTWWEKFTIKKARGGHKCYRRACPNKIEHGDLYAANDFPENQGPRWYNKTRCWDCANEFLYEIIDEDEYV